MAKQPTLTDLTSQYSTQATINNNWAAIEEAFLNTLSRDGSTPNQMEADIDLNSNDLLNAKDGEFSGNLTVKGVNLLETLGGYDAGVISSIRNTFTGDGSTTSFTLTRAPIGKGDVFVFIDGVCQFDTEFNLIGSTLSFTEAPHDGAAIQVMLLNQLDVGTVEAENVGYVGVESSIQEAVDNRGPNFATRAEAAEWLTNENTNKFDGLLFWIEDVIFKCSSGATAISDLPGALPATRITPQHFGAVGDGNLDIFSAMDNATDDTQAFEDMFAYSPVGSALQETSYFIPNGIYCVTSIEIFNKTRLHIEADNAVIYGRATEEKTAVLHMHNVSRFRQSGWLRILSDGSRTTPLYSTNYKCGLRISSNTDAGSPSTLPVYSAPSNQQFWEGLEINLLRAGIVLGNHIDEDQHHEEAQDSIVFRSLYIRAVMQCVYQDVPNSGFQLDTPIMIPQQFNASSEWWDYADSFFIQCNDPNARALVSGGVFQKANIEGWGFHGYNIALNGISYECSAPNRVRGRGWVIDGLDRGFCAGAVEALFQVDDGATGSLTISESEFRRLGLADIESDTAPGNSINFIDASGAPDFDIVIENSTLYEFYFDPLAENDNSHFVKGGNVSLSNVELKNTSGFASYNFKSDSRFMFTTADPDGDSMSTTEDLTAKGGWSSYSLSGGNFAKITSDVPDGKTAAITVESVGNDGGISSASGTSGSRVRPSTDYLLSAFYKRISGGGWLDIRVQFFDFAGTALTGTNRIWQRDNGQHTDDDLDDWNRINVPIKTPAGACFMRFAFQTTSTVKAAITGLNS